MPDGLSEYAWPYMRPCCVAAAALTAQWQAELTSHVRPADMSSKAPRWTVAGAVSALCTETVVRLALEKPPVWNS